MARAEHHDKGKQRQEVVADLSTAHFSKVGGSRSNRPELGGEQMDMSAFMVEDKTINRVVTWLKREVATDWLTLPNLAREYDIDLTSDQWDEKLAQAMFQLNCDGVNARYGEGEAEKFRPLNFTYKPEGDTFRVQVLKSLQCWMYQCNEGNVPHTKLYQFFEEVEHHLAVQIVMDLPAYEKAKWG
jgi:hypothetical protein